MVNSVSDRYTRQELMERACIRIAWNIRSMWEETGRSDSRLFMEPLIPDSFVIVGESKKGTDIKEHVVPRKVLMEECHRMFEAGESTESVAKMLLKYLKIVWVSQSEADRLNKKLKLKQEMPQGWSFKDGNPFSRLESAEIEYELYARYLGTE